jgi:type VI protein secretion system component VasK
MEITLLLLGILLLIGLAVFVIFYKYIFRGIMVLFFGAIIFIGGKIGIISDVMTNILMGVLIGIVALFFLGHFVWKWLKNSRKDEQPIPQNKKDKVRNTTKST